MQNNKITKWTDLVADSEHISEDLQDSLDDAGIVLTDDQHQMLIEFVQVYMHAAIETALESKKWFK